ncbi:MAG: methylenetetrahydrofolate--tRNA-(uracil(54)-C(5))-methyltransferase (FADH(2)-oxidizing) TrmFO [Clostridia bacterium]|nr:methylenetetrahydrofolate--tRNA-(uracil(54)-C(5))-methyltransferase (FADH(2)-oxidizing) TrmFO [Clostridia bacterium]
MSEVAIVGAGLAGCEAAYQLAERGVKVILYEMKPNDRQPAHKSDGFAELVCSNSLRSDRLTNAVGLLKEELRRLGSLVMRAADATRVPAGGALAVDRAAFSQYITDTILTHPSIAVVTETVTEIPDTPCIIASGPLTDGALLRSIESKLGACLHFHDAAAPIVTHESLDMNVIFEASRYDRGSDYLNCPMTRDEYFAFVEAIVSAETVKPHDFESPKVFEGCMPIEVMAKRGSMTLAYGPLKPVGLDDPRRSEAPFAVVQLRRENAEGTLYNLVGFQTNLKFSEQRRVFGMIPGLSAAEYMRYGVMHRNSFISSPGKLNSSYECVDIPMLFFAGQITGVEGYVESASSGFVAALAAHRRLSGAPEIDFGQRTAIGALAHYISGYAGRDFQPMNINYGIMTPPDIRIRNKQARYSAIAERALKTIDDIVANGL